MSASIAPRGVLAQSYDCNPHRGMTLLEVVLRKPGGMLIKIHRPTHIMKLSVSFSVSLSSFARYIVRIACEDNGSVKALYSLRRDAEVAPKCLLRSLVI